MNETEEKNIKLDLILLLLITTPLEKSHANCASASISRRRLPVFEKMEQAIQNTKIPSLVGTTGTKERRLSWKCGRGKG